MPIPSRMDALVPDSHEMATDQSAGVTLFGQLPSGARLRRPQFCRHTSWRVPVRVLLPTMVTGK